MTWSARDIPDQTGRVAVITGGNGGLGLASATALASKGAQIVMAARNQSKAASAVAQIRELHPDASVEVVELDLGSQASVHAAADSIRASHDRLDIVMLNAGVMAVPAETTDDGFDVQMATNVLGHWTLLSDLLPVIVRTPGARVVTLSSTAQHMGRPIDPSDPHMNRHFDAWRMYGQTKLAMRHLAEGLQQQFDAAGVDAKALSAQPGLTNSDLQATTHARGGGGVGAALSERFAELIGMSTDRGALSQLRAATDPAAPGAGFYGPLFVSNGPPVLKPLVRPGRDSAISALWRVAERETGCRVDVGEALADHA